MSQAKVDRYKKEKANRKQIMRKQKMMNFARKAVLGWDIRRGICTSPGKREWWQR